LIEEPYDKQYASAGGVFLEARVVDAVIPSRRRQDDSEVSSVTSLPSDDEDAVQVESEGIAEWPERIAIATRTICRIAAKAM
jgi:hypothetical protein